MKRPTKTQILTLLICFTASLWPNATLDEQYLQNLRQAYDNAETYMQKEEFGLAKEGYLALLKEFPHLIKEHPRFYFNVKMRLAIAYSNQGLFPQAEEILNQIRLENPPSELVSYLEIFRARLRDKQEDRHEAYRILHALDQKKPVKNWEKEDQAFFTNLKKKITDTVHHFLSKAEHLEQSTLYEEAILAYKQALEIVEKKAYPSKVQEQRELQTQLRLKLGENFYKITEYAQAIDVLNAQEKSFSEAYKASLFLLGLSHQKLQQYSMAIESFLNYISLGTPETLPHWANAHMELGLAYYHIGQYPQATHSFQNVSNLPKDLMDTQAFALSQLYIARIHLKKEQASQAQESLNKLEKILTVENPLYYEWSFLQGEILFQNKQYLSAVDYFERAIPKRNKKQAKWYPDTLYNLAWCYLKLGTDTSKGQLYQAQHLEKAQQLLNEHLSIEEDPRSFLALARVYLLQSEHFKDPDATVRVERLLSKTELFKSPENQAEALFLRARAAPSKELKQNFYNQLTEERYQNSPYSCLAWYFQGIYFFERAQGEKENKTDFYEKSIYFFRKAFSQLKERDLEKAGESLKYAAYAYAEMKNQEAYYQSLSLMEQLFDQYQNIFEATKNKDELYYLRGFVASKFMETEENERFVEIFENSLNTIVEKYPESPFCPKALHLLGTTYFQAGNHAKAQEVLIKLAQDYPLSPLAGEAWFWVSEAADWQHKANEDIKKYKKQVYENYPLSKYAGEAYFNFYSFVEYLQGNLEALKHLQQMDTLFPDSPFLVSAYYLLALDSKQDRIDTEGRVVKNKELSLAFENFEKAQNSFIECFEEKKINPSHLEYFTQIYYQARLEQALIKFTIAKEASSSKKRIFYEEAAALFQSIIEDFENPNHELSTLLSKQNSYPKIYEESEYGLAQVCIESAEEELAEKTLSKMLEKYQKNKIKRGYYLAMTWYQLGIISLKNEDFDIALKSFNFAQDAASGNVLSTDQMLELWIQKSHAYKSLGQLEPAMLMLSKVINEYAPSQLRIKAMYLRSEIYELQGRHEFAIKQLESTSQKGGPWALKAQEKLSKNYGFN